MLTFKVDLKPALKAAKQNKEAIEKNARVRAWLGAKAIVLRFRNRLMELATDPAEREYIESVEAVVVKGEVKIQPTITQTSEGESVDQISRRLEFGDEDKDPTFAWRDMMLEYNVHKYKKQKV